VAAIGVPPAAGAQAPLAALPLADPAYEQLAALERGGCAAARVSVDRPYDVRLVRAAIVAARGQPACDGPILTALARRFVGQGRGTLRADSGDGIRLGGAVTMRGTALSNGEFVPFWNDVRARAAGDPPAVGIVHGRVTYAAGDRVAVVVDGYGESNVRNDPTARARPLRRSAGVLDFSEAYVTARAGVFTFTLGRGPEAWLGEGNDSQILSANGPPIDRVAAAFHTAHVEGRALFGSLDDVVLDSARDGLTSTIGPQRVYRYIAGHSITWRPGRAFELTAGETALLSRGSATVDFYYLNPFIPYQITQHDSGRTGDDARDNLTAFAAARTRLGPITASAELLIDDIQVDAARRLDTPDQLGYDLVLAAPVPLPLPATLAVEYQRIDSYTYMRGYYSEVYQQYNVPLGSALGPDADYARVAADLFPTGWLRLAADAGVWRRGLQRIDERPGQSAARHVGEPFPTALAGRPAQTAAIGDVSMQILTPIMPVTGSVAVARIRGANNLPLAATTYVRAQLAVTYAFRYP